MQHAVCPIRVHIEDTDYTGVVYHPTYLKYFERARILWLDGIGVNLSRHAKEGLLYTINTVNMKFFKPARLDDELHIFTKVNSIGRTQLFFEHHATPKENSDCILTQAQVTVVCINDAYKPTRVAKEITEWINHAS